MRYKLMKRQNRGCFLVLFDGVNDRNWIDFSVNNQEW